MWQTISILRFIVNSLPILIQIIKLIEDLIPGKSRGEEKLEYLRSILEETYNATQLVERIAFDEIWKFTKPIVNTIVKFFNTIKIFKSR